MRCFLKECFSFDFERLEGRCEAALHFLYVLFVQVYVALHVSSTLPGHFGWCQGLVLGQNRG